MVELSSKRIVVTGGAGFLGRHLVRTLRERGCSEIMVPRRAQYDLTREAAVEQLYRDTRSQVVFHLAGTAGGISTNRTHPGRLFYDNLVMGALLMEHARRAGVQKFITVGTACVYPKLAPIPFREDDLWIGYPEETSAPYGLAKKMLIVQAQAYRQQYGFNAVCLLPANLYGPGDDDDPETSHVVPALIRKCLQARDAGDPEIVCWGDGSPTREFLYVEDCAEAIVLAAERYDKPDPVNIGTGLEVSIRDLVSLIAALTGFQGRIVWDTSKPNGQSRRSLDVARAEREFGFRAHTDFRQGLARTVAWYERAAIRSRFALLVTGEDRPDGSGYLIQPRGHA